MPKPPFRDVPTRTALLAALLVSALVHAGVVFLFTEVFTAPALDIEFQIPLDVEFGMADEVALAPAPPSDAVEPPPETPGGDTEQHVEGDTEKPKPKPKPKPEKSKAPKPEPPKVGDPGPEQREQRLPAGTQIAVRVDMARIRESPIAQDVRELLEAIPDWKALLDGSGIDPVSELDRLMIASPNLQRSKIIVAGRYSGPEQTVFDAVERLASARAEEVRWRVRDGVRVATWANLDATPRVIALVGPSHFTISREEDLARVLAVAAARAEQNREDKPHEAEETPAAALLSMEADEGLSVEVEGAEQFVRRAARGVPTRLRLSAVQVPGPKLRLRGKLEFADAEKAGDAAGYWEGLRERYARNALVAMLGLAQPLRDGTIAQDEKAVTLTVTLSVEQTRLILSYLRELVRPPAAPPDLSGAP